MKHAERQGVYFRVSDPSWIDPLDTAYSAAAGGRWNPAGAFGALYLNADVVVAAGNARRVYEGEIATLFDLAPHERPDLLYVDVASASFVDAVSDEGLTELGLPGTYPLGVSRDACTQIGARAYAAGEPGIACRTADATERTDTIVEGEELVVFDHAIGLVTRLRRVPFAEWYPLER